ncbi:MAG: tRNA threonylcarbamoyladenosine dehydratase [Clostridia bacterium]|nr:tRNA threonylcarbamoyladenosine dehydratase [Clostridia bacterium]
MSNIFSRTKALLGAENIEKLKNSRVAVFGLGGVGSAAFEALVRSGVGHIDVFDYDTVSTTNLNRQLLATTKTVGMKKTEAARLRAEEINAKAEIELHDMFYLPENSNQINMANFDFVIDAVDTVTAKLEIIKNAIECGTPVISCMGTGNKMDVTKLKVTDISKTEGCPLARVMRKELRARGIENLAVVFSSEKPFKEMDTGELKGNRPSPASAIFVPAAAGLILAEQAVKHIINR